jgi:hypothetical protein
MSDWIKENKFAAAMLAVAVVAIVGTYLFSGTQSEDYEGSLGAFQTSSGDYSSLVRTEPYPDPAGLEAYRKDIVAYKGQVEGLQKALLAFRPEKFEKVRPAEFTTRINEVGNALRKIYDKNGIKYPEKWQLGFEGYTSSPPQDNATDFLNYQLDGLNWLYTALAKSGPSELLNVYRSRLPIEDGEPMGVAPPSGNQRGRGKQQAGPVDPYFTLPVELTFRGPESSLRKFLTEISNSKKYFYVVRAMRVENTKGEIPPKKSDANFKAEEAPEVSDPFGAGVFDFVIPGDDGAPPAEEGEEPAPEEDAPAADVVLPEVDAPASGEQILGRVLGGEEVFVFLELELILFQDNVALPEVK